MRETKFGDPGMFILKESLWSQLSSGLSPRTFFQCSIYNGKVAKDENESR